MGGVWGRNVDSSTTPGQKFLPFLVTLHLVTKYLGNPLHPLESSSQVESWCPCNKFRFLNLKQGDSASAKSIEKTIYFERSWRPGRNGDSAALNANRKAHLAQRRAILANVFIKDRSFQQDVFAQATPARFLLEQPTLRHSVCMYVEKERQRDRESERDGDGGRGGGTQPAVFWWESRPQKS